MQRHDNFLTPRLIQTEFLVNLQRRNDLVQCAAKCGAMSPQPKVLDFGARKAPYRRLFDGKVASFQCADQPSDIEDREIDILISKDGRMDLADETVDVILSLQVLEHVPDVDRYLGEAYRVLKPGGMLWLTTHGMWPYHPTPEDYYRWTLSGLRREIGKRFEIEACDAMFGAPAYAFMIYMRPLWEGTRRINSLQSRVLNHLPGPKRWGKQAPRETRIQNPLAYVGNWIHYLVAPVLNTLMLLAEALTSNTSRQIEAAIFRITARKPSKSEAPH